MKKFASKIRFKLKLQCECYTQHSIQSEKNFKKKIKKKKLFKIKYFFCAQSDKFCMCEN